MSLLMCMFVQDIQAQIRVTPLRLIEGDVTANSHGMRRRDADGKVAALIRIKTSVTDFEFDAGALGIVGQEQGTGEILLWVPHTLKAITIRHAYYEELKYEFKEPLQAACTYEMKLDTPDKGWLALSFTPIEASVRIDGNPYSSPRNNGHIEVMLNYGRRKYEVSADGYETKEGNIVIGREMVELQVNLLEMPLLTLVAPNDDDDIYLNGSFQGTGRWTGRVSSGDYEAEVRREGFQPQPKSFTLAAGENQTVELESPIPLKASLTVRSPLEGAQIYLNGELMGVTEWTGELDAATYTVELRMEDYSTVSETVTLAQREERTLTMEAPTPLFGSLVVNSDPSDCNIYFDDELIENTAEAFRRIAVGNHRLLLTKEGYESVELEVNIEGGRQTTLTPRLEPIVVPQDTIATQDTVTTAMMETLLPDSSIFIPDSQTLPLTLDVISPKKRANAYWRSLLVPGWGDKYVRESERFGVWKTIGAYGLIGAGVGMHFYGKEQYAQYETMAHDRYMGTATYTQEALDDKYALANTCLRMTPMLIGAGAAVWLYDVIWVAVKGHKSHDTSMTLDFDPRANSSFLSYSITF